jgi:N-acetyl-alpha-D-muramate 1-phosphate uridylyltransferase
MKAMILAAGLGTRFKPWTDQHPKALALVNGKTLLERNLLYLQSFGIKDVLVNVHHFAEQIRHAIIVNDGWGSNITISDETDEVLETGGGLKKASAYFDEGAFVLMNADILTDLDLNKMISFHEKKTPLTTLAITDRKSSRYFLFDKNERLCGWRNTKTNEEKISIPGFAMKEKAFSGIHIISPKIFTLMYQQGKFSIVDVYLDLAAAHTILGFDHSGSKMVDVGRPEAIAVAEKLFI